MNKKIILASTSPYRKALMESHNITFHAEKPLCDEDALKDSFSGEAKDLCMYLAKHKATSLSSSHQNAIIIGSDQSLIFKSTILGKGKSFDGSFAQLSKLSGQEALLITAVYIVDQTSEDTSFECNAKLKFKDLTAEEITNYLHLDEPYDCAGSFKFEKNGRSLFESVEISDETAIQGLPMLQLTEVLKEKQKKGSL